MSITAAMNIPEGAQRSVLHRALTNTNNALLSSIALLLQSAAQKVTQLHDAANVLQCACSQERQTVYMIAAVLCYLCEASINADDLPSDIASTSHAEECY
jgi:hypothetical protein